MPSDEPQQPQQVQLQLQLPEAQELGVFADYANVWHTPNSFVLDFLAIKMPPHPQINPENGQPIDGADAILETKVGARVRIPPEQIFPLIAALQTQGNQWLAETGRSEPPDAWAPPQN